MDFGGYGGEASTPNIDQLADEGVRFSHFHASPLCAPSRAMLLTGLESHRRGVAILPEAISDEQSGAPERIGGIAGIEVGAEDECGGQPADRMQPPEPDDGAWPARVFRNRRLNQVSEAENPAARLRFMHQRPALAHAIATSRVRRGG
jgi:hypothetical protein